MARDLLGRDIFARGIPEDLSPMAIPVYAITFNDLLSAYADQRRRQVAVQSLHLAPSRLMTLDAAVRRLSGMLGLAIEWTTLARFLPPDLGDPLLARSALASTFAATLELCRQGKLKLRQERAFAPLFVRAAPVEENR